ncbi:MAG: DNA polymerase III subunit gamma/tau [Alphaproteobacteria bacterium]
MNMSTADKKKNEEYRVLARKYRPQSFDELIGQDALVRTLKNAIKSGRVAHAFMLTGIRGVGKTTTARIIAKALNYKGPDGTGDPTTGDTSDCPLCQAISEDRHPDVIEMDAASRTGVDDIREILDGVRYAPTEARYKIYVIDEVHMLSKNAFNALLKTLEEPPEHVKFIFATTEIRKVPITVLSRCQRFDLQRVSSDLLIRHFESICKKEGYKAENEALTLIARAADGSIRDGLSLLDQAMALSNENITTTLIQDMLGLADRTQNLDLLEKALAGDIAGALDIMDHIHKNGGAPNVTVQDLLDLVHLLTRLRAVPESDDTNQTLSGDQLARAREIATKISMPSLGKAWQILLKGLGEISAAPNPQNAAEMIIIRLAYAANLPDPSDLAKKLKDLENGETQSTQEKNSSGSATGSTTNARATSNIHQQDFTPPQPSGNRMTGTSGQETPRAQHAPELSIVPKAEEIPTLNTLQDVITLLEKHDELLLASQLYHMAHLVKLEHNNYGESPNGKIELRIDDQGSPDISQNLRKKLCEITAHHWIVILSNTNGAPTLASIDKARHDKEINDLAQTPVIKNILELFPDAKLSNIVHNTTQNKNNH